MSRRQTDASDPLLTVGQVADRCQVSTRTVRRWITDGDLAFIRLRRLVRIRERDLDRLLKEHLEQW